MANEIGALHAYLSAGHAQFANDMGKARKSLQTNAAKMHRAMDRVGDAFKATLGHLKRFSGFAIAGGAVGFVALIKKSIDTADHLGKLSQSLGITVESLSTLAHAAELSGVALPELSSSLRLLAKNAFDAAQGTGEAKDAFAGLEIEVRNANGTLKSADILLKEVADRLEGLEEGTLKSALAARIFGRAGAALIPLLNEGSAGIQKMQDRARELGLELDMETALAAAAFNDRITDLKANVTGFGRRIISDALPALNQMVGALMQAYTSGDKLGTALWKMIRAPGELQRTTEEFEKWAEIQRKITEGTRAEKLEVLPYKLFVDVQTRVDAAKAQMSIAKFDAERSEKEAKAAGDKRRAAEAETKDLEKRRRAKTQEVSATMAQLQKTEEAQKRKEAEEKAADKRAADRVQARIRRGEDTISQLQREQDLFDTKTRAETVAWEIEQGNLSDLSSAHQEKILNLAQELDLLDVLKRTQQKRAATEKKDQQELAAIEQEAQQKATQLMTKHRTQQERYNQAVRELNVLFATTHLTLKAYERELENLAEIFQTDLTRAIERWGQRATDALTDFVMTGKMSFRDFANSVIRDLIRMQIQQQLTQPLFTLIQSKLSPVPSPAPKPVPGRATGGPVAAGGFYEITEKGPEVLAMGNRQFLMMSQQGGEVTPIDPGLLPGRAKGGKVRPEEIVEINERDPEVLAMGNRQFLMMSQQGGEITPLEGGLIRAGKRMAIQEQEDEITPIEGGLVRAGKRMAIQERGSEILARGNRQFLERVQQDRPENQTASLRETPETDVSSITPQSVRIINVLDPEVVTNWASSPSGERVVMNIISRHASQLKQLLN